MRAIGAFLVVLGIVAFVYGDISYTKREKVFEVGSLQATVKERKHITLSPVLGAAAILAGIIMVSRRTRAA